MNLLEKLLAFLFGKGGKKQAARTATLEEGRKMVQDGLGIEERALAEFSSKKFAEIRFLLSSLSRAAAALEQTQISTDEGNRRFRQIVVTSQKALARQLAGLSQKILPPQKVTIESVRTYSQNSLRSVQSDILPYWKNIALAKLILKDEVKEIGSKLQELSQTLEALNQRASSEGIVRLQQMEAAFTRLDEYSAAKSRVQEKITAAKRSIEEKESSLSLLRSGLSKLQSSDEYAQHLGLLQEKERLAKEREAVVSSMNSEMASIEKVLKRMQAVSEGSDSLSQKEKDILHMLLSGPFAAIISDPNGAVIKNVLSKAKGMAIRGDIALKAEEKEKRIALLSALSKKDYFTDYFWKANSIQAEQYRVEKELSGLQVSMEIARVERETQSAKAAISESHKELDRLLKEVSRLEGTAQLNLLNALFDAHFHGSATLQIDDHLRP